MTTFTQIDVARKRSKKLIRNASNLGNWVANSVPNPGRILSFVTFQKHSVYLGNRFSYAGMRSMACRYFLQVVKRDVSLVGLQGYRVKERYLKGIL